MDKLQSIIRNISSNASALSLSSTSLSDLSHIMSKGSVEMNAKSNSVNDSLKAVSENISHMTRKMDEASSNIHMVSSATEEMTGTIHEIAKNSETARSISEQAVVKAQNSSDRLSELRNAAVEIGKVTEAINQISEQTNLLALNATIEAARVESALDIILEAGMDKIREKSKKITSYLAYLMEVHLSENPYLFKIGSPLYPEKRSGHIALEHETEAVRIGKALLNHHIIPDSDGMNFHRPLYDFSSSYTRMPPHKTNPRL